MSGSSQIKLVALDMDGTVLNSEKLVSARTKRALKALSDNGIYIVAATGRPPQGIFDYVRDLNLLSDRGYVVCFNGAGIVSLPYVTFVHTSFLSGIDVRELAHISHEHNCKIHAYSYDRGLVLEDEKSHSYREVEHCKVGYVKDNLEKIDEDSRYYKALSVGSAEDLDRLRRTLESRESNNFTIMRSDPNFLEYIPGNCTKGSALEALCQILDISMDNVLAFGDAENDAVMLQKAGIGVAMGNSPDELKSLCRYVTDDNDSDGVAVFIEKFFNLS